MLRYKKILVPFLILITLVYLFLFIKSISVVVLFFLCITLFFFWKNRMVDGLLGFSICLLVTIVFYEYSISTYGNPYYLGLNSDDHMFETTSEIYYKDFGINFKEIYNSIGILHNSAGYVYLLALLRYFSDFFDGYHTLLPRILNVFILQCLAHLIYLKGLSTFRIPSALMNKSVFLFSVFPSILFISQFVFRDIIVSFLIFVIYYLMTSNRRNFYSFLYVAFCLIILFYFRKNAFLIMTMLTMLYLIRIEKISSTIIFAVTIISVLFPIYIDEINSIQNSVSNYDELNSERLGSIGSAIFSLPKVIGFFPRISFLLLNPIIGFSSFEQFFSGLGMVIQVFLYPYLIYGIFNNKIDIKLKLTFLVLFLGVALSTVNFRHITMFFPFAVLIIALSVKKFNFFSSRYNNLLLLTLLYIVFTISIALIL